MIQKAFLSEGYKRIKKASSAVDPLTEFKVRWIKTSKLLLIETKSDQNREREREREREQKKS